LSEGVLWVLFRMETPEAEARPEGYLDVEAEELDDLFSALSRTPEVKIRTLSTGPLGSSGGATPREVQSARPALRTESRARALAGEPDGAARRTTRSASATPARRRAIEGIQAKLRSQRSETAEDVLRGMDKAELVAVAAHLLDYVVGRTKVLKQEKLLKTFQKAGR